MFLCNRYVYAVQFLVVAAAEDKRMSGIPCNLLVESAASFIAGKFKAVERPCRLPACVWACECVANTQDLSLV